MARPETRLANTSDSKEPRRWIESVGVLLFYRGFVNLPFKREDAKELAFLGKYYEKVIIKATVATTGNVLFYGFSI